MAAIDFLYWARDLVTYEPRSKGFFLLNPVTKIVMLSVVMVVSLCWGNPFYNFVMFLVLMIAAYASEIRVLNELAILKWYYVVLFTFFLILFSYTGVLFSRLIPFPTIPLPLVGQYSIGAFLWGLSRTIAVANVVLMGLVLLRSTSTQSILNSLVIVRIPYAIAFCTALAFRFIPTIVESLIITMNAQRARGLDIDRGGVKNALKIITAISTPLLLSMLKTSHNLVVAMRSKGIEIESGRRSRRRTRDFSTADYVTIAGTLVFGVVALVLLIVFQVGTLEEMSSWFARLGWR